MNPLLRFFLQGLLILLPAVLTVYVVYAVVNFLNTAVFSIIGEYASQLLDFTLPSWVSSLIGLIAVLGGITAIGMFASVYVGRYILQAIDRLLQRIPMIRLLYSSLSDLFKAFLGDNKGFDKPVLVHLADTGVGLLGFITREDLTAIGLDEDRVTVYLPQSYNFAGNMIVVSRSQLEPLDAPASQVTALIVSGGVTTSTHRNPVTAEKDSSSAPLQTSKPDHAPE